MDVHAFFDLVISICIASGKGESLQFALLLISPQEIRPHREPHGLSFSACAHSEGTYTPGQNTSALTRIFPYTPLVALLFLEYANPAGISD